MILVVLLMALPGLLSRLDVGFTIVGALWPIGLVFSLLMGLLLVGVIFGWPLMWGTISAEGTDAFDALSRSYAYVYQRPFHYLFYAVVALALGYGGVYAALAFAQAVLYLGAWSLSWWTGTERAAEVFAALRIPPENSTGAATWVFWANATSALVVAYAASYFWTSWTAIYFLLRRTTDATPMDAVYLEEQLDTRPLPQLKKDSAGVPVVEEPEDATEEAKISGESNRNDNGGVETPVAGED